MRIWRMVMAVGIGSVGLLLTGVAYALPAAALVLEKTGASAPDVKPYTEIQVGNVIALTGKATLVFLHYGTCQTIAVVGGTITFSEQAYDVKDGVKEILPGGRCPQKVRLQARSGPQLGGAMFREVRPKLAAPLVVPPRPVFIMTGEHLSDFTSLKISKGDTVVLTAAIEGPTFRWPAEAPLADGHVYDLAFVPKASSEAAVITLKFTVRAPGDAKQDQLVVVTID